MLIQVQALMESLGPYFSTLERLERYHHPE